jgi:hypothetical protein
MFRPIASLSIVLCVALCSGVAYSQTTVSGSVPAIPAVPAAVLSPSGTAPATQAQVDQLSQSVKDLAEEVKKLRERVDAGTGATNSGAQPGAHVPSPSNVTGWQEDRVHDLEERVNDQAVFNRQVAGFLNGAGGPIAGSERPAVVPPRSGMLRIRNEMSTPQDVAINGASLVRVDTHAILNVPVPVGSITTQIRGEGALTWTIGAPTYSQEIIIAPASRNPLDTTATRLVFDPVTGALVPAR